ncbi:DNA-3-methyladenine glycosylase 2 family protein [Microvirga antarctica]|uniref:DNA-3-methyladenine glycosylase 2 family protein n=1 Tax=Microvirga antarctica TaxID=2819233 RepID=UPI001FEC3A22|nr:AlkA N-terminal domain-containing protein [Microvirga antarctica]
MVMVTSENRQSPLPTGARPCDMTLIDPHIGYRALQSRDSRFDGRLFVGVTSTGIYCRPICPARTPKAENCRFFPSSAAAQENGFRPCLRCRPETAPELAFWRGTSNTVSRALALIAEGGLDSSSGVDILAGRLGIGERQLRRLFKQHLGASPVAVAQTRRVLFAKQLIHDTRMPMTEIAFAAGFGSVRRFNETFQTLFRRPPRALRRSAASDVPAGDASQSGVTLLLPYRPPFDWASMLGFLEARAIAGVERVADDTYSRTVRHNGSCGLVTVRHAPTRQSLAVTVRFPCVRALPHILARVRRVFDTGADIDVIGLHLSKDPFLARLVAQRPGLRAPGAWDGFELAVRAILGQQITVEAARHLAGRLVQIAGPSLAGQPDSAPPLSLIFPSADEVVTADLAPLGMPSARRAALTAMAQAAIEDPLLFHAAGTLEEAVDRLRRIRGIGDWTAQYIALRALRETDAFPATDIGLLRGAADVSGRRPTPADLVTRSEQWRPWRAYAAQHLWAADAALAGASKGRLT